MTIVPGGVDGDMFKPMKKDTRILKRLGLSEDDTLVLFAGRLVWEKGVLDTIYAMKSVLEAEGRNKAHLLIIGSGPLKESAERLVDRLGMRESCMFLGSIAYEKMPTYHNLADIFCLPSIPIPNWQEQFGYVFVEAMACGKPVVSTLTGAIPEVAENGRTALLVHPADSHSLAGALGSLVHDEKKRKEMGNAGRKRFLEKFEATVVAGQLADVYKRVG